MRAVEILSLIISGQIIYAGTWGGGVLLTDMKDINWSAANNGLTGYYVNCFAVNADSIYAGTDYGGIFLSKYDGEMWNNISVSLPISNVFALALKKRVKYFRRY